jgi:hydroxymethylpyrimidine/phosphomethylpyrimidine kinase
MASALTIAGSDSGGGAGIQADLKTFAALGVHGTSVLTCVTAQNPRVVVEVQPCRPSIICSQLEAVFDQLPPVAAKTGMLFSARTVEIVTNFFKNLRVPLVVDPVMVSTSGGRLLQSAALRSLKSKLLTIATLVTPNVAEAEALTGRTVRTAEDLRRAAREMHRRFGCATVVKGGHLRGLTEAVDVFYDGNDELVLTAPFVKGIRTHGTGCTYSAAVTAYLACGFPLTKAVAKGKQFITQAIQQSQMVAGHRVLNSFWEQSR